MFLLRSVPLLRVPSRSMRIGIDPFTLFVHLAWLGLFAHVVWYVARFAIRSPYQDEWYFTGVLAASELNWRWVWDLHSEHRYPLGKILYWWLTTTTGDFRIGAYVTAMLNGAAALGLMAVARRLRGRSSLVDVLFPALLLNWGQFENYLFGYQIVFSLTSTGMAVILAAAALATRERSFACGLVAGVALLVVMQGGGYGLVAVPPVAMWLVQIAWHDRSKRRMGALISFSSISIAYVAIVFAHFERGGSTSPLRPAFDHVTVFLQALGCGLGDGAATLGHPIPLFGIVVFAAYLLALGRLMFVFVWKPAERIRALGIAGILAWSLVSALAIAMVRDAGYAPRYAGPGSIGLCALVLTAILYGPTFRRRWLAGMAIVAAIGLVLVNVPTARYVGHLRREHFKGFTRDLAEGMPPRYLASKYGDILFFPDRPLSPHLAPLANARYRGFEGLGVDPAIREIPLEIPASATLSATEPRPPLELWSGPSREVHGVRLRFMLPQALPMLVLVVKDETGRIMPVYLRPGTGEHETLFAIGWRVTRLTLEPASQAPEIRVLAVSLEVPAE